MSAPSREQVADALVQVVRDTLTRAEKAHIPGLGLFHIHHQISQIQEHPDGRIEMQPPRDLIAFTPE